MMNMLQEIRKNKFLEKLYKKHCHVFTKKAKQTYGCSNQEAKNAFFRTLNILNEEKKCREYYKKSENREEYLLELAMGNLAIYLIKNGNEYVLTKIYYAHRNLFIAYVHKKIICDSAKAQHIFHDTIIIFKKNILEEKLTRLTSSIKSYLYGIGDNMIKKFKDAEKKQFEFKKKYEAKVKSETNITERELSPFQEKALECLNKLSEKRQKIIKLFHCERFSMEAIANNVGFNSADVAKTEKSKALKEWRRIVKESEIDRKSK
ncbi:MAG: hypothetical protein ACPG49_02540 [Chitinophagales bacterium]